MIEIIVIVLVAYGIASTWAAIDNRNKMEFWREKADFLEEVNEMKKPVQFYHGKQHSFEDMMPNPPVDYSKIKGTVCAYCGLEKDHTPACPVGKGDYGPWNSGKGFGIVND